MTDVLLSVERLRVKFGAFTAVNDISFDLHAGETLGLVGESGSGKSTVARAILRLVPAAGGRVLWRGEDLLALSGPRLRARRRNLQIIFQDATASLDPRMSIGRTLAEPLDIFEPRLSNAGKRARVIAMLERVGLPGTAAHRYPHEFSGGQCQRIGIARAMMLSPALLVCDEPVSSLDVSIQGQIVNLLTDLQTELGTSLLFISHNLAVVRHMSHRILVIYHGKLVEVASRERLFETPHHPYTRLLLAAISNPTRAAKDARPPSQSGSGCPFRVRCTYAVDVCGTSDPVLEEVSGADHFVACHQWREVVYS